MLTAVGSDNPFRLSNIPKKFWNDPTGRAQDRRLQKYLQKYLRNFDAQVEAGLGLVLFGEPGIGKTHCMAQIAVTGIIAKKKVRWIRADHLASLNGLGWEARAKRDYARLEEIRAKWKTLITCDILCIDDFNRSTVPRNIATTQALEHTIKKRLDFEKTVLITSNHTRLAFKREFGEEILNWLSEANALITVQGDNLRPRIYRKKFANASRR